MYVRENLTFEKNSRFKIEHLKFSQLQIIS